MKITEREKEILKLAIFSNKVIAEKLHLSIYTVKTYFNHMFNNFDCANRTELLFKAIKQGVIKNDEVVF